MRYKLQAGLFLAFLIWWIGAVVAHSQEPTPVIELVVDRQKVERTETLQAILVLDNPTPFALTNISSQLKSSSFSLRETSPLPEMIVPYSSAEAVFALNSSEQGTHNILFTVSYHWSDDEGTEHAMIKTAVAPEIEVTSKFNLGDAAFLLPLFAGFLVGQLGTILNTWWQGKREDQTQREQAIGVTLATLQVARKAVQENKPASFALWEESVVKGNLYPALHEYGRKIQKPGLSKQLAELSITLADYNGRQAKGNLPETLLSQIQTELTAIIQLLENYS